MALKLTVKPGETIYIGTAEISVQSEAIVSVLVGGHAPILRSEDHVSEAAATTPATRLQFIVQQMYLTGDIAAHHIQYFEAAQALLAAEPQHSALIGEVNRLLTNGSTYKAIKAMKVLVNPALSQTRTRLKLSG